MHYETLTKIILINTVVLSVESSKSHNNDCNMITATIDMKVGTATHRRHNKSNYSTTEEFLGL